MQSGPTTYTTRSATERDLEAIAAIYGHAVRTSTATFDLDPPDREYWMRRLDGQHPGDHLLVATPDPGHGGDGDEVVGYAYSWSFRPRPAYDNTRETSIYLHDAARGHGVGRLLYRALLQTMSVSGVHTAIAAVALPNDASERLHRSVGFEKVAHLNQVGRKFDEWIDMALYQLMLVNLP